MRFLMLLLIALCAPVFAAEPPPRDQVSLSASASGEVENDTLVAVLSVQRQGNDTARLAAEVNRVMQKWLPRIREVQAVKFQTLDYRTEPVYTKGTISAWRVRQSLQLKSGDFEALSALVGRLQDEMAVQSIRYEVSDARRDAAQEQLIRQALDNFSQRAGLIAGQLKRPGYELMQISVQTNGAMPGPRPMMRAMAMEAAVAPPVLEPGEAQLTVTVSGSIHLLP